jgi:hypothetical protein
VIEMAVINQRGSRHSFRMNQGVMAVVLLSASGLGCSGQLDIGGLDGGPGTGTNGANAGGDVLQPAGGGNDGGSFSSTVVAAALAQCSLPHGPPVALSTGNDVVAQVTGAWIVCPAESDAVSALPSPGLILEPDGTWYRLVDDGDGGLVTGTGVQDQGPWSAFCEASSTISNDQTCVYGGLPDLYVSIKTLGNDTSPMGCLVAPTAFESSPRRMYIVDQPGSYCSANSTGTYHFWLVPL